MKEIYAVLLSLTLFATGTVFAQTPALDQSLPPLAIGDKGELILEGGEYSYRPWSSSDAKNMVHVLQYFPATLSAKNIFGPFTDRLKTDVPHGQFVVTTVLNLDRAMWGTGGLVTSEVKSNKEEFPDASMVLDEGGLGEEVWDLGKNGALLVVLNSSGKVMFLKRDSLTEQEMEDTIALMLSEISS